MAIEQNLVNRIFSQPSTTPTLKNTSITDMLAEYHDFKKERIKDTSASLNQILELLPYATNQDSVTNIKKGLSNLERRADTNDATKLTHDIVTGALLTREGQINQYTQSLENSELIINDAGFLDKESEFVDLHSTVMSITNKDDGSKKYESVMEWAAEEYAKVNSYYEQIDSGYKKGLRRGKGVDDKNILTKIGEYKNRLDVTMEALIGDNIIGKS